MEVIYNTKGDSDSYTKNYRGKNGKGQGWIRRSVLTYTQKSVSMLANPQGLSPFYFLPSMLIYREIFISNIYIGIYGCNRQSTRTISFFSSLHMYKKSVFLIKSPQGPDIQHREVYEPCLIKSMAKKKNFKYKMLYVSVISESVCCSLKTSTKLQID